MAETVDLQRLLVSMEASHAKMARELTRANAAARTSARRIESEFNRMNTRVTGALRGAGRVAAQFGLALGGAAIVRQIGRAVTAVAELGDAAEAAGVSAERLQVFRTFVEQNGASVRDADDALKRFNRRLGEFANSGGGPAARAMELLSVSVEDANGNLRASDAVFEEVLQKLSEIEDQARVSALAAQLFGDDAGPRLLQALRQGVQGLNETEARMRRLGILMSDEMVAKAKDLGDQFAFLSQIITTRFQSAVLSAIGGAEDSGAAFEKFASTIGDFFDLIARNIGLLDNVAIALIGLRVAGPVGLVIGGLISVLRDLAVSDTAAKDAIDAHTNALTTLNGVITGEMQNASLEYLTARRDEIQAALDAAAAERVLTQARLDQLRVIVNEPQLGGPAVNEQQRREIEALTGALAANNEQLEIARENVARLNNEIVNHPGGAAPGAAVSTPVGVTGVPGGGGASGAVARVQGDLDARLKALRETVASELEIEQQSFAERLAELEQFQRARLLSEEEALALREDLTEQHLDRIAELEREANLDRIANMESYTSAFASIFGSLADIVGSESEKQLRVSKAFAIAEAVINTAQGITKALASSAPPLNFIQAAAVAAAGAAQIAAIRRAQPGNASTPSVGGGGAAAGAIEGPSQTVNVHLRGGPAFSESQVRDLIEQINKASGNGARIKVFGR